MSLIGTTVSQEDSWSPTPDFPVGSLSTVVSKQTQGLFGSVRQAIHNTVIVKPRQKVIFKVTMGNYNAICSER